MALVVCVCVFFPSIHHLLPHWKRNDENDESRCARTHARREIHNDVKHLKAINRMYYSNLMFSLIIYARAHHLWSTLFHFQLVFASLFHLHSIGHVLSVQPVSLNATSIQNRQYSIIRRFIWFASWAINDLIEMVCSHFIAFFLVLWLLLQAERTILATSIHCAKRQQHTISSIDFGNHFIFVSNVFSFCWVRVRVYKQQLCLCFLDS